MNMTIFKTVLSILAFGSYGINAQITVNAAPTAAQLVTNTLIGNGVSVSNITFVGQVSQKGSFIGGSSNIGLPNGVLLSSGRVVDCVPPAQPNVGQFGGPGDADLLATAQSVTSNPSSGQIISTADAAVLEFDFVPDGNAVTFNFVFASEEYLTYVNTQFNDAFGFYLTGTNPAGGNYTNQNLALVPGTNEPITISTIHPGLNSAYYVGTPVGHTFNGFTIPIEISFAVICGETYHFKFAVADCQDDYLDTGVFLEGGSFTSVPVEIDFNTTIQGGNVQNDSTVYEGCNQYTDIIFTRPGCQAFDSLTVDLAITGTSINGVDFGLLADTIFFPPGVNNVTWSLDVFADGLIEGAESIIFTITALNPAGDTVTATGTLWINEPSPLVVSGPDVYYYCITDSSDITGSASGGFAPYTYLWDTGDTTTTISVAITGNGTFDYYLTATDACGYTDTDTISIIMNQTLAIDTMMMWPSNACDPTGVVQGVATGLTVAAGQPYYNWTGPNTNPGPYNIDASVLEDIPSGWYYFTVTDDVCTVEDSIFVEPLDPPVAQFSPSPSSGCTPLTVTFTNNSQNTTTYYWDFGNGQTASVGNSGSQTQTYTSNATVMLIAYSDPTCSDTTYANISISICGCMDPNAVNYDPTAAVDDGSCAYPQPEVIAPNVFTPNNDGNNSFFVVDTRNVVQLELTVLNRWGNVMYTADENITLPGSFVGWNGKTVSGADAQEGTYFYTYVATGIDGNQAEGHGFLELIID
jgi:gliding motility-associated-like protein